MSLSTLMPLLVVLLRKFRMTHTVVSKLTVLEVHLHTLITSGTSKFLESIGEKLLKRREIIAEKRDSINASGHKYGMSTVGVGWIIWRSMEYLPKELIFELHYLGAVNKVLIYYFNHSNSGSVDRLFI